jgi:hypothetical protein
VLRCPQCSKPVEQSFRFCPWCAAPQRLKLVEFFRAHPEISQDATKALRVSQYFGPTPAESHVRLSVWNDGRAEAAVSLDEHEARRLAQFLERSHSLGTRAAALGERWRRAARSLVS